MKWILTLSVILMVLTSCTAPQTQPTPAPVSTDLSQANMPNPAAVYCEEQGNKLEIRTAADGSQNGVCIFPDGSECDEWAYFRKECIPASQTESTSSPTEIPTAMPIDTAEYQQGWWTYTHPIYNFSIMLPEDWIVDETTASDPLTNGHVLMLHPRLQGEGAEGLLIRMTFRRTGEDVLLWPTGVGAGQFIQQGTLDVTGQPARRILLVCPTGEVTAIWYHNAEEDQPNIARGDMEFGFIYSVGGHCDAGFSLSGKTQRWGEMIIASLKAP
jgi:putative hemolysin